MYHNIWHPNRGDEDAVEQKRFVLYRTKMIPTQQSAQMIDIGDAIATKLSINCYQEGMNGVFYDPQTGELVIRFTRKKLHPLINNEHENILDLRKIYNTFAETVLLARRGEIFERIHDVNQAQDIKLEPVASTYLPPLPPKPTRPSIPTGIRAAIEAVVPFVSNHQSRLHRWWFECEEQIESLRALMNREFPRVFAAIWNQEQAPSIKSDTRHSIETAFQSIEKTVSQETRIAAVDDKDEKPEWSTDEKRDVLLQVGSITVTLHIRSGSVELEYEIDGIGGALKTPESRSFNVGNHIPALKGLIVDRTSPATVRIEGAQVVQSH